MLSRDHHGNDRQTILALLQVQLQLCIIGTPQGTLVGLLVYIVVFSMLLDSGPGVRADALFYHHVVCVAPPLFLVFDERHAWVEMAVTSGRSMEIVYFGKLCAQMQISSTYSMCLMMPLGYLGFIKHI